MQTMRSPPSDESMPGGCSDKAVTTSKNFTHFGIDFCLLNGYIMSMAIEKQKFTISNWKDASLSLYETISISFRVKEIYTLVDSPSESIGVTLKKELLTEPYLKDYDAYEKPTTWSQKWNLSNWGFFGAYENNILIGCAAVAWKTPSVCMLEDKDDLAVLWDIRVAPEYRGLGVGKTLFDAVKQWSKERNIKILKIETQNINVQACRFYDKQGCQLTSFNMRAYSDLPEEIQLIWRLKL